MWRDFVRSQIDNCMRIFAAFIAESQTDFIDGFFVGKKISDMKDNRGNKMKDYILRQRLAEYDAKLDLVYRNFSEYVHLAEKAFYSSVTTSSSEQYGFKVVEGRSNRKYRDELLVAEAAREHGYTDIYRQTLIPMTEMQKLMGKSAFEEILGDLIYKPPGKPILVPNTDKRPAMNVTNAENEFDKIMED